MELLTQEIFNDLVQEAMAEKNISAIDAIIDICQKKELDLECVPDLLDAKLKKVIASEAHKLHMLKKKKKRKEVCSDLLN